MTFVWPFARTKASLVIIAIIYGYIYFISISILVLINVLLSHRFSSGAYVGSMVVPILEMGEIGDVGRRTGMAFTFAAIGSLAGPPISGAINRASGGYKAVGYYAGTSLIASDSKLYV